MSRDPVSLASNLGLIDDLWRQYQSDPDSVDPSWQAVFAAGSVDRLPAAPRPAPLDLGAGASETRSVLNAWPLVSAYRNRGHLAADLDPLDLLVRPGHHELEPATYGLSADDLGRPAGDVDVAGVEPGASLGELIAHLERTYCGSVGLEFAHISTPKKHAWLAERMETRFDTGRPDVVTSRRMLEQLIAAEVFEAFIQKKFPGTKRFSLEGSETLIPLLAQVLDHCSRLGAIEAVLGMAHRGRLNTLTHIMGRRARDLFSEFEDIEPEATLGGGDVKYHLGYSTDRIDPEGNALHVSLAYNPSHLEAVDPVVCGRVRAKQRRHGDWERSKVVGVLIHGDAAFAGQGLVAETLQLSNLHGYRTGGTVHIIVNNQIGFTASPRESRSTPYCTDIAQMIQCPIWHVNGEDLDAVARVVEMAMEYRAAFQSDVVIDMFCYRKYGHNEMDEPSFTNPVMYEEIRTKHTPAKLYGERLIERGVVDAGFIDETNAAKSDELEAELEAGRSADRRPQISAMAGVWSSYAGGLDADCPEVPTAVARERLTEIGLKIATVPGDAAVHPKVLRLLDRRAEMARGERPLDWGMAELLAYGTLLVEGVPVRLTGQDSARGTFSHRHAMLVDIENGAEHMPLLHLDPEQADCRIYDSPLSEAGVLGFDFGYSLDYPDALVIWEAQFGDFVNGAQVILDQFITTCEDKWNRLSGLVLYLPHGYEGQGPEHSSARLERFLQNAAEDNMQIVQPTTGAQQFHLLRRQVLRPYRKPLIVFSPKSLLRLPAAGSALDELAGGEFQRVIGDVDVDPAAVTRAILCSGRLYYDLVDRRAESGDESTAIIRVEQLYPMRAELLEVELGRYASLADIVWAQDEPANMGAATFLRPLLQELAGDHTLRFVAREASASPATGSHKAHAIEQERLLDQAFGNAR